jgi:hypothetical protein
MSPLGWPSGAKSRFDGAPLNVVGALNLALRHAGTGVSTRTARPGSHQRFGGVSRDDGRARRVATAPAPRVRTAKTGTDSSGPLPTRLHRVSRNATETWAVMQPTTTAVSSTRRTRVRGGRAMKPAMVLLIAQNATLDVDSTVRAQSMSSGSVHCSPTANDPTMSAAASTLTMTKTRMVCRRTHAAALAADQLRMTASRSLSRTRSPSQSCRHRWYRSRNQNHARMRRNSARYDETEHWLASPCRRLHFVGR